MMLAHRRFFLVPRRIAVPRVADSIGGEHSFTRLPLVAE